MVIYGAKLPLIVDYKNNISKKSACQKNFMVNYGFMKYMQKGKKTNLKPLAAGTPSGLAR